ncbi:MAG: TIGR00730 family Rossman fold protein [Bacteroides sp.]|nr:TIGR00730 family Rossman fold protein [Bacteroides sp.]
MRSIGIFCSASEDIDKLYFQATHLLGHWIGSEGLRLVCGGADLGLMECIAQATRQSGGEVLGVVPTLLEEKGQVSRYCNHIIYTHDLSDRKDILLRESDILVALPGGLGTLDEVFHVLASATLGYHSKRVVFYNVNGFYDKLLAALDEMRMRSFARKPLSDYYDVAHTFEELILLLKQPN